MYYIGKPEHHDKIYGDQLPTCMTIHEIRHLAAEWGMTPDELLDQFREADEADIEEWGVSGYEPELRTVAQLLEALRHCPPDYRIEVHMGDLPSSGLATIGIDHDCETVDLFAE